MDGKLEGKRKGNGGDGGRGRVDKAISVSKSFKVDLQFPVARIARFLKKGHYARRTGAGAPANLAAVLEYLAAEILEVAGNAERDNRKSRIVPKLVLLAVKNDEELGELLDGITIADSGVLRGINPVLLSRKAAADELKAYSPQTVVATT